MEHTTMEHVVLPEAILARSPSQQEGVSAHEERDHRFWGCELIEEAGILLRLPQVVMVTAQTMLQRFYYRKSLRDFDAFRVAIGCLFLAAKVEEQPKRMREVVSVFYAIYRRRKWGKTRMTQQLLEPESDSYYLWCDWLIMVERQILIDLGFSLYTIMEHPHKYILYYIKILDGSKALAQKAWGYLNDSLRVDLCVRYRAEVIACAAIFLASRMLQVKLPMSPPWFELFDVDETALLQASTVIMELYTRKKIVWLDPLTEVNPFAIDDLPDAEPQAVRQSAAVDNVPEKPVDSTRLDDHKPPTSSTSSPSTCTASVSREEASKVSRGSRSGRSESRRSVSRDRGHRRRSRRSSSRSASRRRSRDRRRSRSRSSERHTSSRRRRSPSRSRSRPRRR